MKARESATAKADEDRWVSATEASRAGGVSTNRIMRAVVSGEVRTQLLPGKLPRYNLADVTKLGPPRALGQAVVKARG